jgi:glycosyltransferase involved in cell wall biosynthesis
LTGKLDFHLLQFVPEPLPTFRADVAVMFGKYLPRHRIHCHLAGRRGTGGPSAQQYSAVDMPAPARSQWGRELAYCAMVVRIMARASRQRYDLVQVRDMVTIGVLVLLFARLKGIPFAYWMSFPMCESRIARARAQLRARPSLKQLLVLAKGKFESFLLYKILLPAARHVFVQSDAMGAAVAARGIDPAKLSSVPMGVDTEVLRPQDVVPRRPEGWEAAPLVAYLGTLDRLRELHVAIDALALVRHDFPEARLLLIGDASAPADVQDLLDHARRRGVGEAVRVTGWMAPAQAWELLAGADAAISYIPRGILFDVSSPTKLLEYLAMAMPSVGNDNPDQAQVLDGSQAGWLTASDAGAMAAALAAIFADRAQARARAASGPGFIERHRSYRVLAETLASRYKQLI